MSELQLLPDRILQKQICTNCLQYLSVLPVRQNKKGDIYCGRCVIEDDFENSDGDTPVSYLIIDTTESYMFNEVAKNYLFKCVNHYEGCKELVDVSNSEEHELECWYEPHECFFCSFQGNWGQILQHSLQSHSSNVTKNGLIQFDVGCKFLQKLIYIVKNNIFLLTFKITEDNFSLIISPEVVDNLIINQFALKFFVPSDSGNEKFLFTDYSLFDLNSINYFKKSSKEFIKRFGRKTRISCQILLQQVKLSQKEMDLEKRFIDINVRENELLQREQLIENKEIELKEQRESLQSLTSLIKKLVSTFLTCVKCKEIVEDAALFCTQNHCYCAACLTDRCIICQKTSEFTNVVELNKIIVTCDWPNCTEPVKLRNFLDHKRNCSWRPYKCPLKQCHETVYSCQELISHWHCRLPPLISDEVLEYDEGSEYEFYWLLDKNLFHVVIHFKQEINNNLLVIVEDIVVLPHNFKFKIEGLYFGGWEEKVGSNISEKYVVSSNTTSSTGFQMKKIKISVVKI